jgi:transposase-like protein
MLNESLVRKKIINDKDIMRLVNEGKSIRKVADLLRISMSSVQRAKHLVAAGEDIH